MTTADFMNSYSIAKVLLNLGFDREFDYLIPPRLRGQIQIGMKVNVPFGKGQSLRGAYVVSLAETSERKDLKTIESICEDHPKIPDKLLELGEWMASYYCCPREYAVRCLLPSAVRSGRVRDKIEIHYFIADEAKAADLLEHAT